MEAISAAVAEGQAWYDMGGIDAETNPEVTRFKERMKFGGRFTPRPMRRHPRDFVPGWCRRAEVLRARLKG